MTRVLLVSSNVNREPSPVYPLGLAIVAAALADAGHAVEQYDFLASGESEEGFRASIRAFDPDYVCLSLRNLDNCDSIHSASYPDIARRLVEVAREASRAPVIIGGPAFSIMPEHLLAYTGADHGIVGEGERLVCGLIKDLEEGKRPPSLLRNDRLLDGPAIPSPRYSPELVGFYMKESGMINLQTKRGCPHACLYCSYPALEGSGYRSRDPGTVADDMERVKTDYGVDSFFFTDAVFNDSRGHYLAVAEEILRRGLSARWCCYMRPEGVGRREIALLKRAGLYAAELGTDAASDATLDALCKGFSFSDVLEVNRAFVAEKIPCAHFVMFGGPGETPETVADGLSNIRRLEHCVVFAYSGIRILPGTGLYARAVAEGRIAAGDPLREPVYYHSPRVDAETMNRSIEAAFRSRRDRIFPPSEGQKRLSIMHNFNFRGLLWDTLIRFPKG